ncbi:hypothetical protein, conserved [Plasmodium gonderi]|uniref:Small subunit rRNA processing protein n=1 Tax=Plasmodium gonderi TaxID=77519 RepID=A0A1Y1JAQ3_PLAGO|nr:hypothetical protein, conserved [Plasmodium gonderi]GAW79340.1 hypothetical protein, conserved [Plasmodium gonderi]
MDQGNRIRDAEKEEKEEFQHNDIHSEEEESKEINKNKKSQTNLDDTNEGLTDERFQFNDNLWKSIKREESRKGIVYLYDVPIGLNVAKVREIFSNYGSVCRVHLNRVQDDDNEEKKGVMEAFSSSSTLKNERKRTIKKNRKKCIVKYQDGYVEFFEKKDAIKAVRTLNNQMIGGKKRKNIIRDHFWHLKYIKNNFKWSDLISSPLYRKMSRNDQLNHAFKSMYKQYEEYIDKINHMNDKERISADRVNKNSNETWKIGKTKKKKKKKKIISKKVFTPLQFVSMKKEGASKEVTHGIDSGTIEEMIIESPPEVARKVSPDTPKSTVSADLLRLLM